MENANSDLTPASVQGESTSGHTGNHNRSPDTSAGTAATAFVTATDQDAQPATAQDAGTSGLHQQPSALSWVGNLNRSPDTSAGTTASAMVTATDRDPQPATAQDAGTSGEHQQLNALGPAGNIIQNGADHNRSLDTSAGTTASAMVTETDRDPQPAPAQEAGTSAEGQPPDMANPTQFICPICLGTAFRRDQLKRMKCNHVFHQACIDSWIYHYGRCPVCNKPYRRLRRNNRHKKQRRPWRIRWWLH